MNFHNFNTSNKQLKLARVTSYRMGNLSGFCSGETFAPHKLSKSVLRISISWFTYSPSLSNFVGFKSHAMCSVSRAGALESFWGHWVLLEPTGHASVPLLCSPAPLRKIITLQSTALPRPSELSSFKFIVQRLVPSLLSPSHQPREGDVEKIQLWWVFTCKLKDNMTSEETIYFLNKNVPGHTVHDSSGRLLYKCLFL